MTISPIHRPTFVNALGISLGQELGPFSGLMAARFLKLICRTTMMLWWVCAAGKYSDLVHASIDFVVDWQHRPFCPQELCMCWLGNRCRFWTGFPKQMCQTFCISLVWRVCSCGISKLRYLHDGGLDKLQLESALLCNEKYILCVYNGGRANLKYFYSQTMAAVVIVVFHFALCLLEQGLCYLITFLGSRLNKDFCISWLYFLDQCRNCIEQCISSTGIQVTSDRGTGVFRLEC